MLDTKKLKTFLNNVTDAEIRGELEVSSLKQSGEKVYRYQSDDWLYERSECGSTSRGVREVVFYKSKPVWLSNIYGRSYDAFASRSEQLQMMRYQASAGDTLNSCLAESGSLKYIRNISGDISGFSGEEMLYSHGDEVYTALYTGGLLDDAY